jgi:hypothetical protein
MLHLFFGCFLQGEGVNNVAMDACYIYFLGAFYKERVLWMLQRMHATSIVKQAVTAGEGSFKLCVLSGVGLLSFSDMLLVRGQVHDFFLFAHAVDSFWFCWHGRGSFPFVPCYPPSVGCFCLNKVWHGFISY